MGFILVEKKYTARPLCNYSTKEYEIDRPTANNATKGGTIYLTTHRVLSAYCR